MQSRRLRQVIGTEAGRRGSLALLRAADDTCWRVFWSTACARRQNWSALLLCYQPYDSVRGSIRCLSGRRLWPRGESAPWSPRCCTASKVQQHTCLLKAQLCQMLHNSSSMWVISGPQYSQRTVVRVLHVRRPQSACSPWHLEGRTLQVSSDSRLVAESARSGTKKTEETEPKRRPQRSLLLRADPGGLPQPGNAAR